MTPEQPAHDLVRGSDDTPVVLTVEAHGYRGHIKARFLDRYIEHHGQTSKAGAVDDGDDPRRNLGIELLTQLWECLEIVLPGDLVPPQKEHHKDSTDLVFSHDACNSPGVLNDRWAGTLSPKKYFVVFAPHPAEDDPLLVVCGDGQARDRAKLWKLREIVEQLEKQADDHLIAYTCCIPPKHHPTPPST